MLKHVNFTTYYPQGNGQDESTNKRLGTLLTKLVSENKTDWDEHLSIVLFSYITVYKVARGYTPYQLVYGLHPSMPIEYILLVVSGDQKDNASVKILINKVLKLEKLQEAKMQVVKTNDIQQWNKKLWGQQKNPEKQFNFGDYVMWFPKGK